MDKKLILLTIFVILVSLVMVRAEITYPIAELGNCASETTCQTYCDEVSHMEACLNFAEKNGLMSAEEIAEARKFMPLMQAGETPGSCKNHRECEVYCDDETHINECIDFAVKAGIIPAEEAEIVKKTGGKGPGGCKGKEECDSYCEDETHINECIDFAVANGFISAEEAEIVKKTGGKGPGGCKKDECDSYCQDESHLEECINFAVANGLITQEDAEMQRKTGGKGPGGCKGKEECDSFCKNPDNMNICTNFAIEHGLGTPQELDNMKKNQEWMQSSEGQCYSSCLKDTGLSFNDCGENGAGPSGCKDCSDKCFNHENTNCLNEERWAQLNQDCQAKGSGYHLEEVRGSDGNGGECVTDMTCVYGSREEWENQEEKDRKLAEMQQQWDKERAQYEAENGPGESGANNGEYTGGCTQPGPEGQCNPGPGAEVSNGGSGENEPRSAEPSGGESAPVTGGLISDIDSKNNLFIKILKFIFGIN